MSKTLDMGCGDIPRNPFHADEIFGVDVRDNLEGNVKCADLAIDRIPFADDYFDYVTAHDFLEHIPRVLYKACESSGRPVRWNAFVELMNEVYRVLKPGGLFLSVTPAYPHGVAFRDPTHVNFITDETFPLYFDDENRWASIYGFSGAFRVSIHKCEGLQIRAVLQKVVSPETETNPPSRNNLISVIIPVYNGEKYLSKTLDSLLSQSFINFEAICVDDCSTDSTEQILLEYARRDTRIRVLKTSENLGSVPRVLNFVLPFVNGGFFVYSSQDDLFSEDWLDKMHQRSLETGADAVIPDVVFYYEDEPSKNISMIGFKGDRQVHITGREAMEQTLDWSIPGYALLNVDIIRKIGFEEFAVNADEYSVRKILLHCNKVVFSEGTYFYRQDNDQAITKNKSPNSFDWPYTQLRLAQLLQEYSFPIDLVQREIRRAVSDMSTLQKWLESNNHVLTSMDLDRINLKIERFERRLGCQYPFSELPRDPYGDVTVKWRRSLKKIPLKIARLLGLSNADLSK
jgi:glycosyltransferase involved in cell wall biosynthesis